MLKTAHPKPMGWPRAAMVAWLLAGSHANAQTSPAAAPVPGPSEAAPQAAPVARSAAPAGPIQPSATLFAGRLLGDAGGVRTRLDAIGISLGLLEQSEVVSNPTGGTHRGAAYEGVTSLGLGLDTQRAFGWTGGAFNVSAFEYHGRGLTQDDLPNLTALSGVEQTARGIRLFELWYEQLALNKVVAIRVGQMSVDQEFMTTLYGGLFLNAGYGFPTLASSDLPSGGIDYPLSTPGVRLKIVPDRRWSGLVGVFNGNPSGRGPGDPQKRDGGGTAFRLDDGVFAIAELQYATDRSGRGLTGTYKIGGWYQSDLADAAAARGHRGDYSLYATADQLVWSKPGTSGGGVAVFLRVMAAPPDRNLVDGFVQAGISDRAPWRGRDNDTVGMAVTWSHISSSAARFASDQAALAGRPLPARRAETVIGLTYQAQLASWLQVQPNVQYVLDPGGGVADPASGRRVGNTLVLALRTSVTF